MWAKGALEAVSSTAYTPCLNIPQKVIHSHILTSFTGDYIVDKDEEYNKVNFEKLKKLRTVFKKDGL